MGLDPAVFWSLTVREFWIKHAAFTRAEDRRRSEVIELALLTTTYKDRVRNQMEQTKNRLRRYPIKRWLLSE